MSYNRDVFVFQCPASRSHILLCVNPPSFPVGRKNFHFPWFRFPQGESATRTISDFSSYLLPLLPKQGIKWLIFRNWTFSLSDSFFSLACFFVRQPIWNIHMSSSVLCLMVIGLPLVGTRSSLAVSCDQVNISVLQDWGPKHRPKNLYSCRTLYEISLWVVSSLFCNYS